MGPRKLASIGRGTYATDTIGQALRAWDRSYSAQLSGLANVQLRSAAIGQVLDAWNHGVRDQLADIGRITYTTDTIRQTLDTLDQAIRDQNPDLILADMQSDAVGQAIPGLERPPAAQITVRAVVLMAFVLLGTALWRRRRTGQPKPSRGSLSWWRCGTPWTCGSGAGCPRLPDRRKMLVVLGFPSRFATVLALRRRKPRQRVQAGS